MRILGFIAFLILLFLLSSAWGFGIGNRRGLAEGLKKGREIGYTEACQDAANGKLKMTAVTKWEWKNDVNEK